MNPLRLLTVLLLIGLTGTWAIAAREGPVQPRFTPSALPYTIGSWHGSEAPPLDAATRAELGADGYVTRTYTAGGDPVGLYIAYYARQRPGASIHSPLHCLPGTGWETLDVATVPFTASGGRAGSLRRLIVRKNLDRAVVFYWYALHGRMIANELVSTAWLLHDSLRLRRSDAALVRVVVPAGPSNADAEREGLAFVRVVLPYLPRVWG